jgi:hypothetical protein
MSLTTYKLNTIKKAYNYYKHNNINKLWVDGFILAKKRPKLKGYPTVLLFRFRQKIYLLHFLILIIKIPTTIWSNLLM